MSSDDSLPSGWSWATIEEIRASNGPIVYGILQPGPDLPEGVRYVRPTEIVNDKIQLDSLRRTSQEIAKKYERSALLPGDLLISIVGTIGKVARVPAELAGANITQSSARIRPNLSLIEKDFLAWALKSPTLRTQYDKHRLGTGVPRLNIAHIRDLRIPIAPLPEQHRIVAKIEALQERSRKARAALEAIPPLLEQFRQSVLAAAFRGDLTADWRAQHPDVEPASVLLDRIRAERRRRWEEAELSKMQAKGKMPKDEKWKERYEEPEPVDETEMPELPEGWCWARWDEVGRCQNGRAFPSKEYAVQGVKLLRPGNLHVSGTVRWTEGNARYLPNSWADEYPDFMVRGNELVMNLTAQSLKDEFLGRVCLSDESEECLLNQRIARLTPTLLSSRFCLWLFKSPVFRRFVDGLNTGSLIQHMFTSQVLDFRFPVPPMEEQNAIVNSVEQALKSKEVLAESLEAALSQSDILDQSILAKAFCGELVPQDPNDEPASVLLDRIRAEREAQSAKPRAKKKTLGSIKRTKKAPPVSVNKNDDLPLFNSLQK